mgnify:CR=1 FL=1
MEVLTYQRYWITLGKETIFDYPKQFIHSAGPDENSRIAYEALSIYPYSSETIRDFEYASRST